ncbi:hypothetical protein TWF281_008124 [Arthrobotrys megalospora]
MDPPSSLPRSRQKATRLKPESLLPYKEQIRRLYLVENKSQAAVLEALKKEYGLEITIAQLVHLINEVWHFRKRLKPTDHEYIEYKKRKREGEGKHDTRVKLFDIIQDEDNLARKKSRVRVPTYQKIIKAYQNQMLDVQSPPQPLGLEVGTPTPRPVSASPHMTPARSPQHVPTPFYYNMSNLYHKLPSLKLEIVFNSLARIQGAPSPIPPSPSNIVPTSKISVLLSTTGISQNDLSLSRIIDSGTLLSEKEVLEVLQPLVIRFGNRASDPRSLRRALDNFTGSNIPPRFLATLKAFFSNITPIIDDFAVQTFYSAARTGNLSLLKLFVELGILKSSRKSRWHTHARVIGATALQFSIEYRQGPATSLLLHNGIDVNAQPVSDLSQSLLKTAVEVQDLELVNQLFDLGAQDIVFKESYETDEARESYLEELRSAGLTWALSVLQFEINIPAFVHTALDSAIILPDKEILERILQNRATREEDGHPPIPFDSVSHITATRLSGGRLECILKCDALHLDINGVHFDGSTALEIASKRRDQKVIDLLMKYGAGIKQRDLVPPTTTISPLPKTEEKRFDYVSPSQLYKILDKLQSSASSSLWTSYRQSLESVSHLAPFVSLLASSQVVSSDPVVELVTCSIEFAFSYHERSKTFQSIETISGNFSGDISYNNSGSLYLGFQIYSKQGGTLHSAIQEGLHIDINDSASNTASDEHPGLRSAVFLKDRVAALEYLKAMVRDVDESSPVTKAAILKWARGVDDDPTFHKRVVDLYPGLISRMTPTQLSALLALAVHSNLHQSIRDILLHMHEVDKIAILEATWNGDDKTFDLVLNFAHHTTGLAVPPELLMLIAIHAGHIHKVVRLLEKEGVDVNHILDSGTTFLETSATLGRLDITQVLLNAGASHRLHEAKTKAEKSGNFVLSDMIKEHIRRLDPDVNMTATPSDLSTPATASNGQQADIPTPTPAPVIAQSPRDPIVHEYDLYMSSAGMRDILSSADPYGLSWSIPQE